MNDAQPQRAPEREVHCADAVMWLKEPHDFRRCAFVTSLPDTSEVPALSLEEWKRWFTEAAELVMRKTPRDSVAIFFQTDIKVDGAWLDKGALVQRAADRVGLALLWHKIACRKPAGTITFGRPAYSHLLCYSMDLRVDLARSSPDVLADAGASVWTRGMGLEACRLACRFVKEQTQCRTVVDPFCGRGTVLAAANEAGLDAVGVELARKRARQAKALTVAAVERAGKMDGSKP